MKNKKGFTLIELLAVIVILAIIALIATPIILNMISKAKRSAAKDSALGYIDAINYNNELASMNNEYSVNYEVIADGNDIDIDTIDVKMKGKLPDGGTVSISNGRVTNLTLCIDGYSIESTNGKDVEITGTCNAQGITLTKAVFESSSTSWSTIRKAARKKNFGNDLVGATREIDMGSLGKHTVRVANASYPAACKASGYSQTACGLVLEFTDVLEQQKMNSNASYAGGWPATLMRAHLNTDTNSIYSKLPSDLQSVIADTFVVSGHGETSVNTNYTSTDKLYLLAPKEIWNVELNQDTAHSLTRQLDYYAKYNVTSSSYSAVLKPYTGSESNDGWWLRSAELNGSYGTFYTSDQNGRQRGAYASWNRGVSPAFRIG